MKRLLFLPLVLLLALASVSCGDDRYHALLLEAERQVTRSADSCALLLAEAPVEELSREDRALHGLISSWLLYRQYAQEIPAEPLDRAFDYYHASRDPHRRAQVFFLRAVISQDQKRGQASQWMEDLYSACLAVEQTDDYLLASQIYQNYSSKLSEIEQFDEARPWVDKFVESARLSGHTGEYVQALIFKANNCLYAEEARVRREHHTTDGEEVARLTQFDEAFATIYSALRIANEHGLETAQGRIYTQLSIYHSRCQHLDSLLHYARLATTLNARLYAEGKRKQLPQYATLADAYRKLGMADSAIYYARLTFDTPGMPLRNKRVAAQMLYNTYADLKGDYQSSVEWLRTYNLLSDSINKTTIVSNIEAVQDAAVREQETAQLRVEQQHTLSWLIWSVAIGLLCIALISYYMLHNRRHYRQHLQRQEEDFNRMISEMRAAAEARERQERSASAEPPIMAAPAVTDGPTADVASPQPATDAVPPVVPPLDSRLVLTGSTRESVEVEASSILFLTSESNYVKVLHLDAQGKVQSKMIRQTMNNIEAQLNAYPYIIRCHRAFIVNLQHVRHASTAPSGLQLTLDATTLPVPVSKTYISLVRASLG